MFCRRKNIFHRLLCSLTAAACAGGLFLCRTAPVSAAELDPEVQLEAHRALPVQSNAIPGWPNGPIVGAEAAILMESETGAILYSKNIHQKEYPASTTKLLTALIATEQCELNEVVNFSREAVFANPPGSSGIAMDTGQALTMEQCLNAILIRSANEVAFAMAEHITNTSNWSVFAGLMNERAKELGALNSNFTNPNGLPDDNHYTTAYDMAMIGRAFFSNELLCRISLTRRLEIPASDRLPKAKLELSSMQIIPGGAYAYKYLVGCKTGYTSTARYSLVSCAEKDGLKLICVVLNDENPAQYTDTIALFDYGFANFETVNISQTQTKYKIDNAGLFYSGYDILGNSQPLLSLDSDAHIVLPRTASLEDLDSTVSYDTDSKDQAALIHYSYRGVDIGTIAVNYTRNQEDAYSFDSLLYLRPDPEEPDAEAPLIFINITHILAVLAALAVLAFIGLILHSILKNYAFLGKSSGKRGKNSWKQSKKKHSANKFKDYDF